MLGHGSIVSPLSSRGAIATFCAALVVAGVASCGDSHVEDAPADASPTQETSDIDAELPPLAEAGPLPDLYVDPIVLGDAGGLFLCNACICDGTTHYCDDSSGPGGAPFLADASAFGDAGLCAASNTSCLGLPDACAAQPSCECMLANAQFHGGACSCRRDDSGAGLIYGCAIP